MEELVIGMGMGNGKVGRECNYVGIYERVRAATTYPPWVLYGAFLVHRNGWGWGGSLLLKNKGGACSLVYGDKRWNFNVYGHCDRVSQLFPK